MHSSMLYYADILRCFTPLLATVALIDAISHYALFSRHY